MDHVDEHLLMSGHVHNLLYTSVLYMTSFVELNSGFHCLMGLLEALWTHAVLSAKLHAKLKCMKRELRKWPI